LAKDNYKIKENSWIAWLAAKKLKSDSVAIVIGSTIYLNNTTSADFLQNEQWVKHELCHINQFKEHGFVFFIAKYLWESLIKGYYNNKYEIEARQAESK
jgi:hypothetical protein